MNFVEHAFKVAEEECSEIAQEISKCMRFGAHEIYPEIGISNAERVKVEFNDLMGMIILLQKMGKLPEQMFDVGMQIEKQNKFLKNFEYSKKCGTVHEDVKNEN